MIHKQVIVYVGSSVLQRVPSELQECYCSLLPGSGRSSMLAGLIAWRKSSTPSSLQVSAYALRPTFGAGAQLTFWASIPSIHTKLASNNALATSGKNYWWVHWRGLTDVTSKCVKQYASKPNWNFHPLVDLKQSPHVLPHFLHLSFETFKLTIRVGGTQLLALRVAEEVTIAIGGVRYGENLPLVLVVLTQDRTLNGIYLSAAYFPKFQPCMCRKLEAQVAVSYMCLRAK